MSKTLWVPSFVATACLVTASLAAQEPRTQDPSPSAPSTSAPSTPTQERAPAPTTPTSSAAASQSAAKKITLSGCVERQPAGASAAAGPAMPFSLTNAAAVAASAPVGTAGAAAAAPASVAKTYRLDAAEAMISPHVGHKVEVTGTVNEPSSTASASASATPSAPTFKIESVKMVAANCQ